MPVSHALHRHLRGSLASVVQWIDSDHRGFAELRESPDPYRIRWVRCLPFVLLHLGCLGVIWVGWSWTAVAVAAALYFVRMFAITAFYHRYFSHRSYRTSRFMQFLFALVGGASAQRGALWWAYHHREHHRHSDEDDDTHSPVRKGFLWSHIGWFMCTRNFPTDYSKVRDLARYPELVFLNRYDTLVPLGLAGLLFALGSWSASVAPGLGTDGWQLLVWGFFISTTVLFHATASINSLAHLVGRQRYETGDHSRNSLLLALITLGEGWHNNHHHYMHSVRQGWRWWEIDITWYLLRLMAALRLVWNLKPVPRELIRPAGSQAA